MADWQPIATAPKNGAVFMVWLGDADTEMVSFYCLPGTRLSCGWAWRAGKFRPIVGLAMPVVSVQPTHWMELPDPPSLGPPREP